MITRILYCILCIVATPLAYAQSAPAPVGHWQAMPEVVELLPNGVVTSMPGTLTDVSILWKVEDLIDHPSAWFSGAGSYVAVENAPALNPKHLTVSVWYKTPEGIQFGQKPLVLKSAPSHDGAMYQYGLFVADNADYPKMVAFYLSIGGRSHYVTAKNAPLVAGWNRLSATFDGKEMRLYGNGALLGEAVAVTGAVDSYDTPLLFGAYGNLPKTEAYCFEGYISEVTLYDKALTPDLVASTYAEQRIDYPEEGVQAVETPYSSALNAALREGRDVRGETLMNSGGATYDKMKDLLRPLFFSTGHAYTEMGVHNLLFGKNGGAPPYIVPLADGSRISANVYQSKDYLAWHVGDPPEAYGSDLARLEGPYLDGGYWPVLQTAYTDRAGNRFAQECFAGSVTGHEDLVALVKVEVSVPAGNAEATLSARFGDDAMVRLRSAASKGVNTSVDGEQGQSWTFGPGEHTLYALWSPEAPLSDGAAISENIYNDAKLAMKTYWTEQLASVSVFTVPEALVMDAQRNLLIQNLIMRWRYSLGSVVYHDSFYQPESSDAVQTLGEFGDLSAYRDGLSDLLGMTKGKGYYENWERGEKLSHGAHYYYLTRDAGFIEEHTDAYVELCEAFRQQMDEDEYGLLLKQRQCGDIPEVAHYIFHQTVGWRGLRDMAEVWKAIGREDLYARYRPLADTLKARIDTGMAEAVTEMENGSLFVARALHTGEQPYDAITETRIGSYWNLVMPYGFASGYWPMEGSELGRIVDYMHTYGGLFLGLLRFNYYPTEIGAYRRDGLPGYYTTGVDNVYLPAYLRVIAAQDLAERQVLTFYGKLAHGMTRDTFVTGEGSTLGTRPGEYYRSTYGGPTSANNGAFLINLRLMLVRESFDHETGAPENLYLAHATPREWLADGQEIVVDDAPTCFGPVSYRITSALATGTIHVAVDLPSRKPAKAIRLKLRLPDPAQIASANLEEGKEVPFDASTGVIDLSGLTGSHEITVTVESPSLLQKDLALN